MVFVGAGSRAELACCRRALGRKAWGFVSRRKMGQDKCWWKVFGLEMWGNRWNLSSVVDSVQAVMRQEPVACALF